MTEHKTPPDWVLIEAAKRCEGWWTEGTHVSHVRGYYRDSRIFRALCDMIERYETAPVDRKVLCAEEANREYEVREQEWDSIDCCVRAIELWIEGYGK